MAQGRITICDDCGTQRVELDNDPATAANAWQGWFRVTCSEGRETRAEGNFCAPCFKKFLVAAKLVTVAP